MQPLIQELRSLLGPKGWLEGDDALPYSRDWLGEYGDVPLGVARPCSTGETAAVVRACAAGKAIVVPQGGNTGLCGGSVGVAGPAVIVSLSRLNGISKVDTIGHTLEVEAGTVLQRVHEAARQAEMMFPLRLGSEGSARIGGLIATNAGGSHALRYGPIQDLVLGLEVVLADGSVWNGMRPIIKDNAGYQLRRLFCGSEGTLGIVTRALLRLFPAPRHSITALVAVPGIDAALRFAALLRSHADEFLSGLEFFSDIGLDLALRHIPDLDFPLETRSPCYLLVELTSSAATAPLEALWEQVLAEAMENGWILDGAIAGSERQRLHFWRLREEQPEGQRLEGGQIKNDVSVPVARLDAFLREAGNVVAAILPGVRVNAFGHLGDGNVHYNLSPPERGGDFAGRDDELRLAVARIAQNLDGSFAAEHGLGRSKVFLADCLRSRPERMLMRAIKNAFDPAGTLNPGVLVAAASRPDNDTDRPHDPAGSVRHHGD